MLLYTKRRSVNIELFIILLLVTHTYNKMEIHIFIFESQFQINVMHITLSANILFEEMFKKRILENQNNNN